MTRLNRQLAQDDTTLAEQVAALPIHWNADGVFEVLMVTSRDTGRWVMPKGWTMDDLTLWEAAQVEALEEAGAVGPIATQEIGQYNYGKRYDNGAIVDCSVHLFPMLVKELKSHWQEKHERTRRWFTPAKAASLVHEAGLATLLDRLQKDPQDQPLIRDLLEGTSW